MADQTATSAIQTHLVKLTQQLLDCIVAGDYATYVRLCDDSLSCFEPEARGHIVLGLDFHKYYFDLKHRAANATASGSASAPFQTTMASPHVRLLGDSVAVVSYIRLIQRLDAAQHPQTTASEETRVWHKSPVTKEWKLVHFHRSAL